VGSVIFLLIFGYGGWFFKSLTSAIIAVILFAILRLRERSVAISKYD
jgi:hypothetical protein